MGTGISFPGVKPPGREADHSPSAKVKKMWIYTSTPSYAFMAWCLITFTLFLQPSLARNIHGIVSFKAFFSIDKLLC
jgi:hypothetical protein